MAEIVKEHHAGPSVCTYADVYVDICTRWRESVWCVRTRRPIPAPYITFITTIATNAPNPQGYFPGAQELTLRLVYDKAPAARGKLLGAQAFGRAGVEKRVDAAAVALQGGLALSDLAEVDLSYAPPYSSANDPLNLAAFVGMNDLSGAFVVGLGFKKGECGAWRV